MPHIFLKFQPIFRLLTLSLIACILGGCVMFKGLGGDGGRPYNPDHKDGLRPVTPTGLALTKISEGFVPKLYLDAAGNCTIGYGHLVKMGKCDASVPSGFKDGISEGEAEFLLEEDLNIAKKAVMTAVKVQLDDEQYSALVDFVYNVGATHFNSSTLLKRLNDGKHHDVPPQLRRWIYAGGRPLKGLKIRRDREVALYRNALRIKNGRVFVDHQIGDQELLSIAPQAPLPPVDILEGETAQDPS